MVSVAWAAAVITVAGGAGCSSKSSGPDGGFGGSPGHGGAAGGSSVGGRPGTGGTPMGGAGGGPGAGGAGEAPGSGGAGEGPGSGGAGEAPGSGGAAGTPAGGAGGGGGPGSGGAAGTPGGGAGAGGGGQPGCSIPSGPAGTWVEIPAPTGQSNFFITDAFAAGSDDLLFAGSTFDPTGLAAPANARLLRWTRGCWTVELMIPPSATTPDHPSVHGTGPNDLWATASDLLYHRDAQGWTPFADQTWRSTVHQPPSYLGALQFHRVRAAAPNDIWVAATSNVLHWSGASWTTYNFDDPGYPNTSAAIGYGFNDIWIDSPSSVWLVGESDQVGNTMSLGFVHHFNGASWTHAGAAVGNIDAIWRAGVLWLAQPSEDGLTLRSFDGTSASGVQIAGVAPFVDMTSLFGRGANDLWAAGGDVAHFDGQSWSQAADAPAPARNSTNLVTNTFVTGDAGSVWLVTPGPRFFRKITAP